MYKERERERGSDYENENRRKINTLPLTLFTSVMLLFTPTDLFLLLIKKRLFFRRKKVDCLKF